MQHSGCRAGNKRGNTVKIQRTLETAASPQQVWPFLVEPEKILQWFTLLRKFEYTTDQRSGVGAPFYYEEKSGGRIMRLHYRVTEWVEDKRLAFSLTEGPLKKDDQVWGIEATASGSKITLAEEVELAGGVLGRMLGALFVGRTIGKHLEEMLARLGRLAKA
jgi:uncharacterized protein YndB with AHSA1/START domain